MKADSSQTSFPSDQSVCAVQVYRFNADGQATQRVSDQVIAERAVTVMIDKVGSFTIMCTPLDLKALAVGFVFGEGSAQADLMLIGEAPGRDEDLKGIPFVGRAGQLLTLMLQSINLKRDEVFIANVLKCRPPNNRDPQPDEIEKCEPYLLKQIEMISPKLIVTLGRFASASLLRTKSALGTLREEIHNYNQVPLLVTYHPAALLRNPQLKKRAWEDLKKISDFL